MQKIKYVPAIIFLALCSALACWKENQDEKRTIVVFAAAGLTKVMEETAPVFQRETGYRADFDFASSGFLARKIGGGAPGDVFISASREWIEYLKEKKLLAAESEKTVAKTELVCVVPVSAADNNLSASRLTAFGKIAVGDPAHVPAGEYARQSLSFLGIWDELERGDRLVLAWSVPHALTLVESGGVDAAIVYLGDAKSSSKVKIAFTLPSESHEPIEFIGAILRSSSKSQAARAFLDFLTTEQGAGFFEDHGFSTP